MPLRDGDAMVTAAGYAPVYRETHEPFLALALDRGWDVVMCNAGFARVLARRRPAPAHRAVPRPPPPRLKAVKLVLLELRPFIGKC